MSGLFTSPGVCTYRKNTQTHTHRQSGEGRDVGGTEDAVQCVLSDELPEVSFDANTPLSSPGSGAERLSTLQSVWSILNYTCCIFAIFANYYFFYYTRRRPVCATC